MMKKEQFQKILVGLLCLTMLLQAFTACKGKSANEAPTNTETPTSGGDEGDSTPQKHYSGYLDEYRIVRATAIVDQYAQGSCNRLINALSEASGKEVSAVTDNRQKDDGGKEILVGITNRVESEDAIAALDENEFSISVVGNKIVIAGENNLALDRGVKYFVENYIYDIKSVSEIKNYIGSDPYGYAPVSELNQYVYGDHPVVIFSGCIEQDIAFDFATGDIYYSLHNQFCKEDSTIVRRTPDGHQEYMILTHFSHMETFDVERIGDKVYIWCGSRALDDNGESTAVSRFEFQAGTRYEWETGQTFVVTEGKNHGPSLDIANGYFTNWGDVYDREQVLKGDITPVAHFNMPFPYEELGYTKDDLWLQSGGWDICGSYMYVQWQAIEKASKSILIYVVVYNEDGEAIELAKLDPAIQGSNAEANGIKAELVDGVPRVFMAFTNADSQIRRYQTTVVVFSETKFDVVEPTMESLAQLKTVEHNTLPKNAAKTSWTETDGVFSINSIGNTRLTFDEGAFKGEAYTYETTITMNGAELAGINLACGANVSGENKNLGGNGNYIGAQILISKDGKLTVKEVESRVLKEYTIPVQTTYHLKVYVNESGQMTITLNDSEIGAVQLTVDQYRGGHVGVFAENGKASFANTKLTYHHP